MVLYAFLCGLAVSLVALTFVVLRGLSLYRQVKSTSRALSVPLQAIETKTAQIDRHLDAFDHSNKNLEAALARLQQSRAQLQVLRDSLDRAKDRLHWLRVFLPAR